MYPGLAVKYAHSPSASNAKKRMSAKTMITLPILSPTTPPDYGRPDSPLARLTRLAPPQSDIRFRPMSLCVSEWHGWHSGTKSMSLSQPRFL